MDLLPSTKLWLQRSGAFFGALLGGLLLSFVGERVMNDGAVLRGVVVGERNLSDMGVGEIEAAFQEPADKIQRAKFSFRLQDEQLVLRGNDVGVKLDVLALVETALAAGRDGNLLSQFGFWCARLVSVHEISPTVVVRRDQLQKELLPWVEKIAPQPKLPFVKYDDQLVFREGSGGSEVDVEELEERLREAALHGETEIDVPLRTSEPLVSKETEAKRREQIERLLSGSITVEGPSGQKTAKLSQQQLGEGLLVEVDEEKRDLIVRLNSDAVRSSLRRFLGELEVPAQEASFEFSPRGEMTIGESEAGKKANLERLIEDIWAASKTEERTVQLALVVAKPKLTKKQAEELRVKELVSSFVTHHPCCQTRVKNIHRAAGLLDGTVLRPGETFSLNKHLGPRTRRAGYYEAPTIVRGKMKDVFGGGISQLATTLFNAVLRGGYEIVQRQPHSVYFSRYPEGHEATVSFPEPDLIFRNDTKAGMVIKTQFTQTFIKVLVYGDAEGRVTTVNKSRRYKIVEPPKEYEPNEAMDPEEQKRLRAGQLGWTVRVSRTVRMADGTEKKEEREVVYNPRPELLRVHPCVIPEGEEGHTGEECPEPELEEVEEELSEDEYFETE